MKEIALKPSPRSSERRRDFAAIAVAFATYVLLCIPLRDWLVDDAAISMAYAANWTAGHGLVAQPGIAPVEGYSNFLWVVVLAVLNAVGAMTPLGIKAVAAGLVLASLVSLYSTSKLLIPESWLARAAVPVFVASSSSVVTWTTSGLENPLTLLLASELLRVVTLACRDASVPRAIYAGMLVAAAAMTRPDGIALAAFPPLALALFQRRAWRLRLPYASTIAVLFGAFLAFRYMTFGDWMPNTFYAKQASSFDLLQSIGATIDLLWGPFATVLAIPLLLFLALLQALQGREQALLPPLCLMLVAGGAFALLPMDWMPDRRFGTAFMPAVFLFAGVLISQVDDGRLRNVLLAALVLLAVGGNASRLAQQYREPTVPVTLVGQYSKMFDERARILGVDKGSVLMPDIGAALLYSELRVYDLAGLIDPIIARSLHSDHGRLHDYIFEEIRPTFIRTHGPWAEAAALDEDPRFRRDYVPIDEGVDEFLADLNVRMKSGDYVRRDVLEATSDPLMLEKLQAVTLARAAELSDR